MKKSDLHWLAGLLEGEASFSINRQWNGKSYHRIQVSSSDLDVLERVVNLVGGKISGPYKTKAKHHTPLYKWGPSGQAAAEIMKKIYPLMSKRRQEQIINSFTEVEGVSPF